MWYALGAILDGHFQWFSVLQIRQGNRLEPKPEKPSGAAHTMIYRFHGKAALLERNTNW